MLDRLKTLVENLAPFSETIEQKGDGNSSFIYATSNEKSVEVSVDEGMYWVEYWDNSDESSSSVKEQTFQDIEKLEISVKAWLIKIHLNL
ncbi:hypothetical protein [Pleionea sp. CnH1-48]|uniref:hypothetical protein n=1 Tax=Pleionea sp. CnH1-48 TaxID=2954494 RepID=UPI0020978476|nr:hypothetical protein [Pleionea sp. CnH1-48]MCO7225427.1 hypothetical protein [Pleionea sp. CnH1-48]